MVFFIYCVLFLVMIYIIIRNNCLKYLEKLLNMLVCLFKLNIIKFVIYRWFSFKYKEINIYFLIDFFIKI